MGETLRYDYVHDDDGGFFADKGEELSIEEVVSLLNAGEASERRLAEAHAEIVVLVDFVRTRHPVIHMLPAEVFAAIQEEPWMAAAR